MIKNIFLSLFLLPSFLFSEMIEVTENSPITKIYTKKVKTGETCYDTTIEERVNCGNTYQNKNDIGLDTIIGATIGIAVGNQFHGKHKDAAKVIGGVTGAMIANDSRKINTCTTYRTETKCEPIYEYIKEDIIVGYNNCTFYNGQKVCKKTTNPLKYLNITTKIIVH